MQAMLMFALTTDAVTESCDLATETGHFALTITPPNGAPVHDIGKYAVTWHRSGDDWRMVVDIFNSDGPLAAH